MTDKKLQAGDSVTYEIDGKKLIMDPIPWGRLKKVIALVSESATGINDDLMNNQAKFMAWIGTMIEKRMDDLFPLLFNEKKNDFFNKEWVEDNLTLLQIQQIVLDAITINGVQDFLDKKGLGKSVAFTPDPVPKKQTVLN